MNTGRRAPRKLVCLATYWSDRLAQEFPRAARRLGHVLHVRGTKPMREPRP